MPKERASMTVETKTEGPGIPIPEELHAKWRQIRASRNALQGMIDSFVARQTAIADHEAQAWDETFKRCGLIEAAREWLNARDQAIEKPIFWQRLADAEAQLAAAIRALSDNA